MRIPRTPDEARVSHLESARWRQALVWGLRNVPLPLQHRTMPVWSAFFYLQVPHVRRAIELNLSRLLDLRSPRRQVIAFRTFTNYCRCIANAYRVHLGAGLDLAADVSGLEILEDLLSSGRGVVLATGHLGNWHLGPYFLAEHGLPPITVVMSEEPNRGAQAIEEDLRDRRMRVAYVGQSPLLGLELRAALQRGEMVGLQMDRPSLGGGLKVPCGRGTATFALGPAQLARASDVPIVPVFFPLTGQGVRILVQEPIGPTRTGDRDRDLRAMTCQLAEAYSRMIQAYPDQWFTFHDFWGSDR